MKPASAVLLLSTLLNVGVVAAFALRPELAPPAFRDLFHGGPKAPLPSVPTAKPIPQPEKHRALWTELASTDLSTMVARLRAAGLTPDVIREIVRTEVNARFDARVRAFTDPDPNTPFWKQGTNSLYYNNPGRYEEYQALLRERSRVMRDLLGDPALATDDVSATQRRQFGDLPQQKIDALQRIEDDYAEMMSAARAASKGIVLPEDRAKLELLNKEKLADLAAVLTPEELADYRVRSSPITRLLSQQLGEFHASEAEFRAIYDMQQTMNERFPYISGSSMGGADRRAAQQELDAQLRTRLGEARYNDYIRETSDEYRQVRTLAERENLPPGVAVRAFDLRNAASTESQAIVNGPATDEEKRTALTALAQRTRDQVNGLLGPVAGTTYIKVLENTWLRFLSQGSAFALNGGPNMSFGMENTIVSLGASAVPTRSVVPPPVPPPRQ